jgi:hypothetical protein
MKLKHITRLYRSSGLLVASAALVFLVGAHDSPAGIQGTGRMAMLAVGPITATGPGDSVSVDGVQYGLSEAQIKIDGHAGHARQLRVGQIVTVKGTSQGNGIGNANSVAFTGSVVGPIDQIDLAGGTFTVLGQTVSVAATTLFGEGIEPAALGALRVGTDVEVSAFATASGELQASRVDLQTAGAPLQVQGTVQALNSGAQTFQINSLTVDYGQAAVTGPLANGNAVTVIATEFPSAGTLHATNVQAANGVGGVAGMNGQIEGLITSLQSQSAFYVGSQLIVTNSTTSIVLQGRALAPNLAVKVTGTFDSSGALVAKAVHSAAQTP